MDDEEVESWRTPQIEDALGATVPFWLPSTSIALYARWWQLETWLRELIYIELRSLRGVDWLSGVTAAVRRQEVDAEFTHMSGPDNANPLAYLDYSQLVQVIDQHWEQFAHALVRKGSWDGRQDDLRQIRHRIGHMRRPHRDDLARLEQTLNDLEGGAFAACVSFQQGQRPDSRHHCDAVTSGWIEGTHPDAQRLITHAERQYEVSIRISITKRQWAAPVDNYDEAPGHLWHASFYLRDRPIDLARMWRDIAPTSLARKLVVLGTDHPNQLRFTFSAADPAATVADAIGEAFDAVLENLAMYDRDGSDWEAYQRRARALDWRIQSGSPWTIADESTLPFSTFGAGGGVEGLST